MITAEELEKLAELKDKGIITEEEFNAKREEFLGQSNNINSNKKKDDEENDDTSSGSNIGGWIVGILAIIGLLSHCSGGSEGNSNNGICGVYSGFGGGDITLDNGGLVQFNFPTKKVKEDWDKYIGQKICISGNIYKDERYGEYYIVDNPRFIGYQ